MHGSIAATSRSQQSVRAFVRRGSAHPPRSSAHCTLSAIPGARIDELWAIAAAPPIPARSAPTTSEYRVAHGVLPEVFQYPFCSILSVIATAIDDRPELLLEGRHPGTGHPTPGQCTEHRTRSMLSKEGAAHATFACVRTSRLRSPAQAVSFSMLSRDNDPKGIRNPVFGPSMDRQSTRLMVSAPP